MDSLAEIYPFINGMSDAGRELMAARLVWHEAPACQPLVSKGDNIGGVYLVERGSLRVFHIDADGRENTLYWVERGDSCILAMNCVFSNVDYPAWVSADNDAVRFAQMPARLFRQLFEQEHSVRQFAFDGMSGRIFELMAMLAEAVSFGVEQRLVKLLLRKANEDGCVLMSQENIANHLGTAREVVSRSLRSLAARDLVKTRRGAVDLHDRNALQAMISS